MKYGAKRTVCGTGHTHDSKLEAGRCDELTGKEARGEITHLVQQPVYKVEINGKLMCKYVADFSWFTKDCQIIEDVKGFSTPIFNLKKKLVEASHPGTVITVWPPKVKKKRKVVPAKEVATKRLRKQLTGSLKD